MLQRQFTSVFSSDEGCADSNKSLPGKSHPDMAEISITVKGVECLLSHTPQRCPITLLLNNALMYHSLHKIMIFSTA